MPDHHDQPYLDCLRARMNSGDNKAVAEFLHANAKLIGGQLKNRLHQLVQVVDDSEDGLQEMALAYLDGTKNLNGKHFSTVAEARSFFRKAARYKAGEVNRYHSRHKRDVRRQVQIVEDREVAEPLLDDMVAYHDLWAQNILASSFPPRDALILVYHHGDLPAAARQLNITQRSLRSLLEKLGLFPLRHQ